MRLKIPITGTVLVEGSIWGDGKLEGDGNNPIRPISLNLGNVSWRMIDVDLENEEMEIEVTPAEVVGDDTGTIDGEGRPVFNIRKATSQEKVGFLQYARQQVEGHTKDEIYQMSKCQRLKRPSKGK